MSRSRRRTIAYGRSTSSRSGRGRYGYMEDDIKKAQKNGTPVPRCHYRGEMQTLNDYRRYVRHLENDSINYLSTRDKRLKRDLHNFIENRIGEENTINYVVYAIVDDDIESIIDDLMNQFALKLYKRALSR